MKKNIFNGINKYSSVYLSSEYNVAMLFVIGSQCNVYGKYQNKEIYGTSAIKIRTKIKCESNEEITSKHDSVLFCEVKFVPYFRGIFMRAIIHLKKYFSSSLIPMH